MNATTQAQESATSSSATHPASTSQTPSPLHLAVTLRTRGDMKWDSAQIFAAAEAAGFKEVSSRDMTLVDLSSGQTVGRISRMVVRGLRAFTGDATSFEAILNPREVKSTKARRAATVPAGECFQLAIRAMADHLNAEVIDGDGATIPWSAWPKIIESVYDALYEVDDEQLELEARQGAADANEEVTVEMLMGRVRRAASGWWTLLNEMRMHKQLPDWVLRHHPAAGTHEAMEAYRANWDMLVSVLIGQGELPAAVYQLGESLDDGQHTVIDRITGCEVFSGSAINLAAACPRVVEELSAGQLARLASAVHREAQALAVGVEQIGGQS